MDSAILEKTFERVMDEPWSSTGQEYFALLHDSNLFQACDVKTCRLVLVWECPEILVAWSITR